ncbi:MAG: DUF4276 family protein [Actinomycetota bacterium]|nr:DUF4276 family protein [Actinomycetota bacterium]
MQVLVEEVSAEFALRAFLPKIAPGVDHEILSFRGKSDLLKKLPQRLAGYAAWPGATHVRIVVLIDRDREDCIQLRQQLDETAVQAGFAVAGPRRTVLNRIAIEELEAWFLGDIDALKCAYPRFPASTAAKKAFRDPDAIDGTWEALETLLQRHGYHKSGLPKTSAAAEIAEYMDVEKNGSRSFRVFRDGVRRLIEIEGSHAEAE